MRQPNRLKQGGRIDRSKLLNFTFDGKSYAGYQGDTLASALLANGVDVVGRSFKYSRPRGIVAAGAEEPNAIFQLGSSEATSVPNPRATQTELYSGLVCTSTNGWPNVNTDLMGLVGKVGGAMMPPGFYYKTFMYPQSLWPTYENLIRKAAGFGRSPSQRDPDYYDKMNHHCDVLVVGAGPAGLAAALAAANNAARVIIVDEQNEFGGHLLHSRQLIDKRSPLKWVEKVIQQLDKNPNVITMARSTACGYFDQNFMAVVERRSDHLGETSAAGPRQRLHRIRAGQVVLACGAHERPLVFANNDVPGCMLASAISVYLNRYGVAPGNTLTLMTTNDHAYQTAFDWHDQGRKVVAIVDTRNSPGEKVLREAGDRGIEVFRRQAVIEVQGKNRVSGVLVAPLSANGEALVGEPFRYACDTVASSGGWSPVVHLSCHTGSRPVWDESIAGFTPGTTVQNQQSAGGINGTYSLSNVLKEGFAAGAKAVQELGLGDGSLPGEMPVTEDTQETPAMELYHIPHLQPTSRAPKQFVDFQNDVTAAAVELATREGFESIEHVKRYTALGFGTDQGKLGNINGMAITAKALGKTIAETGTTVFRPMYTPVTFGALAGSDAAQLFSPARFTAMHKWHLENGAKFEDVGQ